ncbi:MAG: sulfite exporter TauE/SafE family protein [Nitrososphaerota archaeon]
MYRVSVMISLETVFIIVITFVATLVLTIGGFGGGSVFLAILLFSNVPPSQAATGSLLFNVFSTMFSFIRWRIYFEKKFLLLLVGSVPLAFLGGMFALQLSEHTLKLTMGLVIAFLGLTIFLFSKPIIKREIRNVFHLPFLGGFIGILTGLTGIGGGVYLAPILLLSGLSDSKTTVATTSMFVFANSLAGLLARTSWILKTLQNIQIIMLIPVVVFLAIIGGYIGSRKLVQENVRRIIGLILVILGVLVIFL